MVSLVSLDASYVFINVVVNLTFVIKINKTRVILFVGIYEMVWSGEFLVPCCCFLFVKCFKCMNIDDSFRICYFSATFWFTFLRKIVKVLPIDLYEMLRAYFS